MGENSNFFLTNNTFKMGNNFSYGTIEEIIYRVHVLTFKGIPIKYETMIVKCFTSCENIANFISIQ